MESDNQSGQRDGGVMRGKAKNRECQLKSKTSHRDRGAYQSHNMRELRVPPKHALHDTSYHFLTIIAILMVTLLIG